MTEQDPTEVPDREPVSGARKGPGARLAVLYAAMVLFIVAVLSLDRPKGLLEVTLHGLRQVFFFGFAGLIALELTALVGRRWIRKRSLYYAVALVAVIAMAIGYELMAPGAAGEAPDPWRAMRNLLGAAAFLTLSGALDKGLRREHVWLRGWPRRALGLGSALVLAIVFHKMFIISTSYAGRAGAFPIVVDLTADWQEPFITVEHAELFVGKGPPAWERRAGRPVAVVLFDGTPGGGVTVDEPYKDWGGFDIMSIHLYSVAETPIEMTLRIDDRTRAPPPDERVERRLVVTPGANDFYIPLDNLQTTPSGRKMNMETVRRFGFYLAEEHAPVRIYMHHVRISEQ